MIAVWMLRMLVATTLIGLGASLIARVLRAFGLPQRWAWVAGLCAVMAAPFVALMVPAVPAVAGTAAGLLDLEALQFSGDTVAGGVPMLDPAVGPVGLLGIAWLAAAVLGAVVYGAGWWRLRSARRGWRPSRVAGASVLVSPGAGPAAVGILQPAIVVPEWLLSEEEPVQRLVVLHESQHLAAGDHVVLAVAPLALVMMPWNVTLWWMVRRLRLAVELDCDSRVLASGVEPSVYGSLLLDVAGRGGVGALSIALASPRSSLEQRIEALAGVLPGAGQARTLVFAVAALFCIALACGVAPTAPLDRTEVGEHSVALDVTAAELIGRFGSPATSWMIDGQAASVAAVRALPRNGIALVRIEENVTRRIGNASESTGSRSVVNVVTPAHLAANPALLESPSVVPGEGGSAPDEVRKLLDDPDLHVVIDGRESDRTALRSLEGADIVKLEIVRRRTGDNVVSNVHIETVAARSN
jgi:hypothetical protein